MWVTPRDLEILARVHAVRACDSAALGDLFPTSRALRQRLWRLTREGFIRVHRVGNQRAYSLGRRGVHALGLTAKEVRVSRDAAAHCLLYATVRRELQAEGYVLNGQDQVGRTTLVRAWRDGRQIAAAVCNPGAPPRAVQGLVHRLRSLVNPFDPLVDELMIFGPAHFLRAASKLPVAYRGRVTIHSLPFRTSRFAMGPGLMVGASAPRCEADRQVERRRPCSESPFGGVTLKGGLEA